MIQLRELGEYLAEPLGRGWAEGRSAGSMGRDGAVPWGVVEVRNCRGRVTGTVEVVIRGMYGGPGVEAVAISV